MKHSILAITLLLTISAGCNQIFKIKGKRQLPIDLDAGRRGESGAATDGAESSASAATAPHSAAASAESSALQGVSNATTPLTAAVSLSAGTSSGASLGSASSSTVVVGGALDAATDMDAGVDGGAFPNASSSQSSATLPASASMGAGSVLASATASFTSATLSASAATSSTLLAVSASASASAIDTSLCGNRQLDNNEECDDGNREAIDGCSSQCSKEGGWLLKVNAGLSPAFSPEKSAYVVQLPFHTQNFYVSAGVPNTASLQIGGMDLGTGGTWELKALPVGESIVTLKVKQSGAAAREITLSVRRSSARETYFKASDAEAEDQFGTSVAISGDGKTMAVGDPYQDGMNGVGASGGDNNEPDAGAVYIFERQPNGSWKEAHYIKAYQYGPGDLFGYAVSMSADGKRLLVGAPKSDGGGRGVTELDGDSLAPDSGAAYLFEQQSDGRWQETTYFKAPNAGAADQFGTSVSLSGDGKVLAVGAPEEDGSGLGVSSGAQSDDALLGSGAAYLYSQGPSGVWQTAGYFKASNTEAVDGFGYRVVLDYKGDTFAVSAIRESSMVGGGLAAPKDGAVYVFGRSTGQWLQTAYLKGQAPLCKRFGQALALSEHGTTLAVGAAEESGGHGTQDEDAGAVYAFTRSSDGSWARQASLKAANPSLWDYLGTSVALSADGNTLAAGAPEEASMTRGVLFTPATDDDAALAGAVYVWQRDANGNWHDGAYIKSSNSGYPDRFGQSLALTSDGAGLVVGAPGEASIGQGLGADPLSDAAERSGAVYFFE